MNNPDTLIIEPHAEFKLTDTAHGQVTGKIWVDPKLDYFAGHFPDNPILPGVVQVHWAALVTQWHYESLPISAFSGMSNIKFKSPIMPGSWMQLTLQRKDQKVAFHYATSSAPCTQGQLFYHG